MKSKSFVVQLVHLLLSFCLPCLLAAQNEKKVATGKTDTLLFDYPGFVKIKRGEDYFLLDDQGREYLFANDLNQLSPSVTAFDFRKKNLKTFPAIVLANPQLKVLLLAQNNLQNLPPEISTLQNLQWLDLSFNPLIGVPSELGALKNLETLNLGFGHKLTSLPPEIGGLKNLRSLNLSGNPFSEIPSMVFQLKNLQTFFFVSNKLYKLPGEIGELQNLQTLHLSWNQLVTLPAEIVELKNLRELRLVFNSLIALPKEIGALQNLQSLSCDGNLLSTLPAELGRLERLQSLTLTNNELTVLPPEIGNLQNLQSLNLCNNQLTSLPGELSTLVNLKELNLSGNSLPLEASTKMVTALPNCRVGFDDEVMILGKQLEEELFNADKFPPALQIVEILAQRLEADSLNIDLKIDLANACGAAAFFAVFAEKPEMAISLAERGLALNPDGEWVEANLALGHLYEGNWEKAKSIYERLMFKLTGNQQQETYREIFLQDLDALEAEGITHPDVTKARALLEN